MLKISNRGQKEEYIKDYRLFTNDNLLILKYHDVSIKLYKKKNEVVITTKDYVLNCIEHKKTKFLVYGLPIYVECKSIELKKSSLFLEYILLNSKKEELQNQKVFIEWE